MSVGATNRTHRDGVRRFMTALVAVSLPLAGCSTGASTPVAGPQSSAAKSTSSAGALANRHGEVGAPTARALVDKLNEAGFAAPNPLDTTAQDCRVAGCVQSVVTDTVRVMSFATTGQAQIYAANRNLYQVTTIVVEFAPPLTHSDQLRYQVEIQKLVD
ncbi:hypothetical protein FHT40_002715 [Mycolicibacterium sp. BK556]|uniref:hypothetical protein n=1 Tax=Mycobacteriaceae TaxID=1762 RepID=UPI00105F57F7|nr:MULTISPECIES: hypothetical protein [Mycobacteriaceae]MBB3603054.1 hypothetical protein [Mycolicibacterium sp. BK556]MBB3633249.1 hypothetical protein [Mycolicibacterium sp. BK607]MBB3750805.1 hypothetical protein [Mycolicibacterium sp. BK634]TDO07223.1 hypothetical protein EV580_6189 [Mycobacterium sp. BK086]